MLHGRKFSTADENVEEFRRLFFDHPQDMFLKCFESWFNLMHKRIRIVGGYFEKLKIDFFMFLTIFNFSIFVTDHVSSNQELSPKRTFIIDTSICC